MDNEQPTSAKKATLTGYIVAIVCLTIGYIGGAKNTDHWEFKISDEAIKNYDVLKTNKRTGEVWAWEVTSKKWVEVKDGVGKD
tara:strand:- start:176 stop:424 length:249 start_codon:yes stop_codon:yes gene_type:complete